MSGKAVGWAMEQVTGSPVTKLVLLKLADNASADTAEAFPSLRKIVKHTELSKRTVIDHLERLGGCCAECPADCDKHLGLIRIVRAEADGQHLLNRYFLNMPLESETPAPAKVVRGSHPKKLIIAQPVVESPESPANPSPVEPAEGGVAATPLVNPAHEGGVAPASGVVNLLHGGGVADAIPPAPPIEINPQVNPQVEPSPNAGARASADVPEFLVRDPFEKFMVACEWHPATNRSAVKGEYAGLVEPPEWTELTLAARRYAARLAEQNAKRRKDDPVPAVAAQNFIRKRMWEDYPETAVEQMVRLQPLQAKPWGAHPAAMKLLDEFGAERFNTWFRPCTLSEVDGIPVLSTPSKLIRDTIAAQYIDSVERAFGKTVVVQ